MSVNYKISAVHVFRAFLVQELYSSGVLTIGDYYVTGFNVPISPVIPVQDIPEFTDDLSNKTYLVYDLVTDIDQEQWWHETDEVTLNIISENLDKQYEVIEFLKHRFSRGDITADEANAFSVANGHPFRFEHFYLAEASVSKASGSEAGRVTAPAVLVYTYHRVAS